MELTWFTLVLIYILLNSTSKILQKQLLNHESVDDTAFSVVFQLMPGLFTLPLLFFEPIRFPSQPIVWVALLASCFGYACCMTLYFYGLKRTEISQVETIGTTRSIWMMLIGVIFFGEIISLSKIIGVCLIIASIAVVYVRRSSLPAMGKNQAAVLLYAIIISFCYALDKYVLGYFSLALFQVLIFTIPAGLTLALFPGAAKKIIPIFKVKRNYPLMFACFLAQAVSLLALYRAYQTGGQLSVVGPIAQTTTLVTITVGVLMLHEYWNLKRKVIGIGLALTGILFLRFLSF